MISEKRVSEALTYLAQTDEASANAKGLLVGLEEQRKTVKAVEFQKAGGTMAEREAAAYASAAYRDHLEKLVDATVEYETLRNKRLRQQLVIEVWRSMNANRRAGNV